MTPGGSDLQPTAHFGTGRNAGTLKDYAAFAQYDEVRYGLDGEARGEVGMRLGVHLEDEGAAGGITRESLDFGSGHAEPQRPVSAGCLAGTRFCAPQAGQTRIMV